MSSEKGRVADLIREVVAADRRRSGPPPSPDELAAYVAGELSEAEEERIRNHLTLDPESRRVVRDLVSFPHLEPPSEEYRVTDQQLAEEWQALTERPDFPLRPPARGPQAGLGAWMASLGARLRVGPRPALALAAGLLLVSIGLSLWAFNLQRRLSSPFANVEISELMPVDELVRSGDAEPTTVVRPASSRVLWILDLATKTPHPEHAVEIVDAKGKLIWTAHGLERNSLGVFTVDLARNDLLAGEYTVRLFGLDGTDRTLLAEYPVRIEFQ